MINPLPQPARGVICSTFGWSLALSEDPFVLIALILVAIVGYPFKEGEQDHLSQLF